jgi:hypothetical protein
MSDDERRRFRLWTFLLLVLYLGVTAAVMVWLRAHPTSDLRVPLALVPLLPLGGAVVLVIRLFRRSDELAHRIQIESLAYGFLLSAPVIVTYGFLEMAGLPRVSVWWSWVVLALGWWVGRRIAVRRYR